MKSGTTTETFAKLYNDLNNSFTEKCVFTVGHSAGFFSEINNMIFAMLYCLENKIKFIPYTKSANFSNGRGWIEFFEPFCEEFELRIEENINYRYDDTIKSLKNRNILKWIRFKIREFLFKKKHNIKYLTYNLWPLFFNSTFLSGERLLQIKELKIAGSIYFEAGNDIAQMIWRFNDPTTKEVSKIINKLNLPEKYVSIHIRAGDKIIEVDKLIEGNEYIDKVKENCEIKDVFVFTDNYEQVLQLIKGYPEYTFYTLCGADEKGYENDVFQKLDWSSKRQGLLKLFANIQICLNSKLFIGSNQANPDIFLRMLMDRNKLTFIK